MLRQDTEKHTETALDFALSPFSAALIDKVKDCLGRRLCPADDFRSAYTIWSSSSADWSLSSLTPMNFRLDFAGAWGGEDPDPSDCAYATWAFGLRLWFAVAILCSIFWFGRILARRLDAVLRRTKRPCEPEFPSLCACILPRKVRVGVKQERRTCYVDLSRGGMEVSREDNLVQDASRGRSDQGGRRQGGPK